MATVTIKVDGLDKLQEQLAQISDRMGQNALRSATNAGAALIRNEARAQAPEYEVDKHHRIAAGHPLPGTLKRSIITKFIREESTSTNVVYYVTVRKGIKYRKQGKNGNLSQDAYYASWIEFGHYAGGSTKGMTQKSARAARKAGALDGARYVLARPFMRPAFDAQKENAVAAMKEKLAARLDDALK